MQVGDHLVTPRTGYTHHGLYIGNQQVIHYEGKFGSDSGRIAKVTLTEFCKGASCRVRDYPLRVYGRKESIEHACQRVGESDYNLVFNNCEHFVAWCIMGFGYSEQINTVVSAAIQTKALMETQGTQAVAAVVPTSAALVTGTVALASGWSIASVTPLAVPIAAGAIVGYGVKKLIDWVW